jgi:hypothetical protein
MKNLRTLFRPPVDDPGAEWVENLLSPLRGESVACDVAPRLMERIAADPAVPRPIDIIGNTSRLAWAGSLLVGFSAFVFLLSALVMIVAGEDEGVRPLWTMLEPAGRLVGMGAHYLYRLAVSVGAAGLAILRGSWVVVVAASPLIRGAGLFAAAGGLLSIVISTYLFAHARRTAPTTGPRGDESLPGGSR